MNVCLSGCRSTSEGAPLTLLGMRGGHSRITNDIGGRSSWLSRWDGRGAFWAVQTMHVRFRVGLCEDEALIPSKPAPELTAECVVILQLRRRSGSTELATYDMIRWSADRAKSSQLTITPHGKLACWRAALRQAPLVQKPPAALHPSLPCGHSTGSRRTRACMPRKHKQLLETSFLTEDVTYQIANFSRRVLRRYRLSQVSQSRHSAILRLWKTNHKQLREDGAPGFDGQPPCEHAFRTGFS